MMSARETVEQFVEFRAVVFVDRMAEFVDNHVVDQLVGQLHQVRAVSFGPSGVQLPGVPCPVMFFGGSR